MAIDQEILQRAVQREKQARKEAEKILEKKASELYILTQELSKSKQQLELLVEKKSSELSGLIQNIIDPYLLLDLSGYIINMNKAASNLFLEIGQDVPEERINLINMVPKHERGRMAEAFLKMVNEGFVKDVQLSLNDNSGSIKHLLINASLVFGNDGKPTAAQGIARDITAIKLLQEEKDKLFDNLEVRNDELNEYAHIVSHDLKSPLRGINSLFHWIKNDETNSISDESYKMFDMIDKSILKMERLISGILKYSTSVIEDDDKELISMETIIRDVMDVIQVPDYITVTLPTKLPSLLISRNRIDQIVQNLMTNAVKYVPNPGGTITWDYLQKDDKHMFSIKDNGIGIAQKHHDRIFQVFQSLTTSKDSTGIGLSIVKKVVKSLGGDIWLESEEGKGATFYFTIDKKIK